MRLMIDIPDETYNKMRRGEELYPADANVAIFAIETGTPLEESEDCVGRHVVFEQINNWSKDEFLRVTNPLHYLRKRIDSLQPVTPQMNRWIPVSEKLPEDGKRVIWCFKDGAINIERYKCDAIDHFYPQQGQHGLEEAVAWMPLPEPYVASPTGAERNEE